jgi:hypothetical protein
MLERNPGRRGGWEARSRDRRYAQLETVDFLDYPGAEPVLIFE